MAYIDADAILTAVRSAVQSGGGTYLVVDEDRFSGEHYNALDGTGQSIRALTVPRAEARITNLTPMRRSPLEQATTTYYLVDIDIDVVRHLNGAHKLVDATRDNIKALAVQDADVLAQSLMYPANMNAAITGVISGRFRFLGSTIRDPELTDDGPGLIRSTHKFQGIVQVAPA